MKTARGFTLIELLVVISIIGVLAALLMPVFSNVRAAGYTTKCLSQLKQIGLALQMYTDENNGRLPFLQNRASTNNAQPALDTVLLSYVSGQSALFACPADRERLYVSTGTSYFWNFTVNGQDVNNLFSVIGGTQASQVPLVSDKEGFHVDLIDKVNVLYVDGHADKELKFSTTLSP